MFQNDKKDIYNLKNIALLVCFTVVFGLCFSVAHQLVLSSDLKINILEWIKTSTILFIVLLISWEIMVLCQDLAQVKMRNLSSS